MQIDLSALTGADSGRYNACVIGSGPAGLTVALRLAERGRRVLLLEAGSDTWTEESQDVYYGRTEGDPYLDLDATRLRFLGGTSNHWSGWCRHLDEIDFQRRSGSDDAAWPIEKWDLDPYLAEASRILEIEEIPEDKLIDKKTGIKQIHFVLSPPVRFQDKYLEKLNASVEIDYCINANVTGFTCDGARVTALQVQDYARREATVPVETVVLTAGGIENSRLLLWGNRQTQGRLVDSRSPLGAYWMEHPHFEVGEALVATSLFPDHRFFSLTAQKQEELGVLNCGLRIHPIGRRGARGLIKSLACVAPDLARQAASLLDRDLFCGARITAAWEQEPIPQNRVALSTTETDRFGIPRPVLHWTKTKQDRNTVRQTLRQLGMYLANTDLGRVRILDWLENDEDFPVNDELGGCHHMGGTRMARTPEKGVVDADCRVHGLENLYIGGSSVFPSGGHANPTLTIVQLALRLADHLAPA